MYFRVNLKMEKGTFCCCFTWILFIIDLNFTVAFMSVRKIWDDRFAGKGMGQLKKRGDDLRTLLNAAVVLLQFVLFNSSFVYIFDL